MIANILTFRAVMEETSGEVFRVIEISDQRTLLELMCTVLETFESQFYHLMQIQYDTRTFVLTEEVEDDDNLEDADLIQIRSLKLHPADELTLIYDYMQNWSFKLTLIDSKRMEKETGNSYPRLISGAGPGMLEEGHGFYLLYLDAKPRGEEGMKEFGIVFQSLGIPVPEIPEFDLEKINAHLKQNVKKAVKDCRDQVWSQMPDPYEMNFRVYLKGFGRKLWRKIVVSGNDTLNDLNRTILMSFEAELSHMYDLEFRGTKYGTPNSYYFVRTFDDNQFYLYELGLAPGDKMLLTYDYGENWEFTLTYKGDGDMISDLSKYPKILGGGRGWGILEDDYYHFAKLISDYKLNENDVDELMSCYGEIPNVTDLDLEINDKVVRGEMQRSHQGKN